MSIGLTEIILILIVVVLLFGSKRIPELAKALGKASHEYKKAKETLEDEVKSLNKKESPKKKQVKKTGKKSKPSAKKTQKRK